MPNISSGKAKVPFNVLLSHFKFETLFYVGGEGLDRLSR